MLQQLKEIGADTEDFQNIGADFFATIKFKPSDLKLLDEPRLFSPDDPAITSNYYNLKNKISNPSFVKNEFTFVPGHKKGKEKTTKSYSARNEDNDLFHNRMQTAIFEQFVKSYGKKNVGTEQSTGFGSRIDLVLNTGSKQKLNFVFFELKTSNSIRQCIREALSQLMEYSFFPNREHAKKLIIVSHNKIDSNNAKYLKKLRKKFSLPIYYQQFDTSSNLLLETEY